jgi:hypothetical protein
MRYSGVVDAPASLNDVDRFTLKADFRTKRTWIRGKGRGGKGKKQEGPPLAEHVERRLREYLTWGRGSWSRRGSPMRTCLSWVHEVTTANDESGEGCVGEDEQ